MQVIFVLIYLVMGIVQLFAIMDGISYALNVGGVVSFLIALFTTYIPFLGAGLGIYGAVNVWEWSIWQAAALFFWFIPAAIIFGLAGAWSERQE